MFQVSCEEFVDKLGGVWQIKLVLLGWDLLGSNQVAKD